MRDHRTGSRKGKRPIVRDHRKRGHSGGRAPGRDHHGAPGSHGYYDSHGYYGGYGYYDPYYYGYYGGYGYGYGGYYGDGYGYGAAGYGAAGYGGAVRREAPRSPLRLSVGLRTRATRIKGGEAGSGLGVLARLGSGRFAVEGEIAEDQYDNIGRTDLRFGGTGYLMLSDGVIAPYVLLGAGVNRVRQVDRFDDTLQGYAEGGGGLAWRLGRSLSLEGEVRWTTSRRLTDSVELQSRGGVADRESAMQLGVAAVLSF